MKRSQADAWFSKYHYDKDTGSLYIRLKNRLREIVCRDAHGYIILTCKGKQYKAHRVIMEMMGYDIYGMEVDHINHIRDDNRLCNLRVVSPTENQRNKSIQVNSKTLVPGVCWHSQFSKWRAYIVLGNKQMSLGCYDDFFDAVCARKSEESKRGFHLNHGGLNEEK